MHCQLHFWRTYICRNNYNVSQHNIIKVYFFDLQNPLKEYSSNYLCIFDTTEYSMKLNFYFYLQTLEFKIKRIMFMELFIKINLGTFFSMCFSVCFQRCMWKYMHTISSEITQAMNFDVFPPFPPPTYL